MRNDLVERKSQPHFGLVHAFYAVMGGFAFYGPYDDNTPDAKESLFEISTNPLHTLDIPKSDALVYIMRYFPHIITDITEEYILDRAESSSLSKALLVVQVGWFCTNCVSRLVQHLPLSLLEVSTAAHAVCTLFTYFVWWSKPINVAAPTILREKEAREVHALLKCSEEEYDEALEVAQKLAAGDSSTPVGNHGLEKVVLAANALQHLLPTLERPPYFFRSRTQHILVPGSLVTESGSNGFYELTTTAVSPVLYGLVHFLAWGDQFPIPLERLLWRISSFVVTFSGFVGVAGTLGLGALELLTRAKPIFLRLALLICYVMMPIVYVLASGFLVVESFRQLFFLDPAAYQLPNWSYYLPHFA
jgi:hypothetical protein